MCLIQNENSNLENKNFESLRYNILDATEDILLDNLCDPDLTYFVTAIQYVIPEEFIVNTKTVLLMIFHSSTLI